MVPPFLIIYNKYKKKKRAAVIQPLRVLVFDINQING